MALSPEQVTALLDQLAASHAQSQQIAESNQQLAVTHRNEQRATMDQMSKLLMEVMNRNITAEKENDSKKLPKKGEKELDSRSFQRVEKFDGGELH